MTLLGLHTQLLELLDWDEEMTEEAIKRTIEISKEISLDGEGVVRQDLKKVLRQEYNEDVCDALLDFFDVASRFEEELKKHEDEEIEQ